MFLTPNLQTPVMTWTFNELAPTSGLDPFPSGSGNGRLGMRLRTETESLVLPG